MLLMEPARKLQADSVRPETPREPALMAALGQLLRGLSALFWGLPIVLVTAVQAAKAELPRSVHLWAVLAAFGLILYGVHLMSGFQPQERVWQFAVDRVRIASLINLGLSPFVVWWSRFPGEFAFQVMVDCLVIGFLFFLIEMNPFLDRLVAMLPDEAMRQETRFFTRINRMILVPIFGIAAFYFLILRLEPSFPVISPWFAFLSEGGLWGVLFLLLLPIAMTMALVWKIKETIFHSVFGR
jgi:hypothetical protein